MQGVTSETLTQFCLRIEKKMPELLEFGHFFVYLPRK